MIVVVMGVSGCGKTTVGSKLAERLGAGFLEGDRFHPPANIAKMCRGEPLDDADRRPWLEGLAAELGRRHGGGESVVLACSALRRSYRDLLLAGCPSARFVHLMGSPALVRSRLQQRKGHFMPPALLDSQFAALETPEAGEALAVDIAADPDAIVDAVMAQLAAWVPEDGTSVGEGNGRKRR